jgi:sugar-specific transcriptional regulator TrmB
MENVLSFLQQLDLSEIEAKLYLTLLKNGPTSVRDLAETIDIKRTTAYFYIDQLVDKGLLTKLVKSSKKVVAANPPKTLEHLVKEKVDSAKHVEESFPNILETLTTSLPQNDDTSDAEITYYKGKNSVIKVYEDAFKASELRSYIKLVEIENAFPNNVALFQNALKNNEHIKIKEIFYDSPLSRQEAKKIAASSDRYSYKFMPKDIHFNSEDILIYDGKVAIIHYKSNKESNCVVLNSIDYYNNSKEFFDFIWKTIPLDNSD